MEIEKQTQINESAKKSSKKKFTAVTIALLAVLAGGSYFLPDNFNIWSKLNISSGSNTAAVINGEIITKSDLDLRIERLKESRQLQGVDLADKKTLAEIKKQMLNDMISEKIIIQNALKSGVVASDNEILAAYNELVAKFKTKEDFQKELTSKNLTENGVKEDISKRITLNRYIEQNVDLKNLNVTDEEINNLYKDYGSKQKNMPKLEEIRTQLANEVRQQKSKTMIIELIEKLKKNANIKIFL